MAADETPLGHACPDLGTDKDQAVAAAAQASLEDPDNTILFSAVSIWEIAIKAAMMKPAVPFNAAVILNEAHLVGFAEETITCAAAITAANLPDHHRDPFDRLLVSQAINGPARFMTADRRLARYSNLVDVI